MSAMMVAQLRKALDEYSYDAIVVLARNAVPGALRHILWESVEQHGP